MKINWPIEASKHHVILWIRYKSSNDKTGSPVIVGIFPIGVRFSVTLSLNRLQCSCRFFLASESLLP